MLSFDWLSIVLTAFLVISLLSGLRKGFFRQIASITGIALGFILASRLYAQAGQWLGGYFGQLGIQVLYVLGFVMVFAAVIIAASIVDFIMTRVFSLPGLNVINALAGAIVGLALGAFMCGIVLSLLLALGIPSVSGAIEKSIVPYYLISAVTWAYDMLGFSVPQLEDAIPIFKGFMI